MIGALVVLGAGWLLTGVTLRAQLDGVWLRVPGIAGPAVAGALIAAFSPVRPWREPLMATIAAILGLVVIMAAREDGREMLREHWQQSAIQLGLACAAAVGAAALVRWVAPRFNVGPGSIVLLGGLISLGIFALSMNIGPAWGRLVMMFAGSFLAGFLTQGSIATPRAWLCGSGAVLLLFRMITEHRSDDWGGTAALALLLVLVAHWGAKVAWRRMIARGHLPEVDMPSAHTAS